MEEDAVRQLIEAEQELQKIQRENPDRERAIALTHLQTAILWLHKPFIDSYLESRYPED